MLDRLRDDTSTVKIVRLPRGHAGPISPARSSMPTPGSCGSVENHSSYGLDQSQSSSDLRDLQGIGITELLDQDERPTFIVDLMDPENSAPGPLKIVFKNAPIRASARVDAIVSEQPQYSSDFSRFKAWVLHFVKYNNPMDVCLPSLTYGGISWTSFTVRNRFRFVSAAVSTTSPPPPTPIAQTIFESNFPRDDSLPSGLDFFGDAETDRSPGADRRAHSEPQDSMNSSLGTWLAETAESSAVDEPATHLEKPSFDWTRIPDISNMTSHLQFMRLNNWDVTPLGPIEQWPSDLRTMSNMVIGCPHPAAMYWGPDYTAIYNEAYLDLAGNKHPRLMGQNYRDAWAEIWDDVKPIFDAAWDHGQAVMKQDDQLFISRNGFLEETFFNWSIVPLVGIDGSVVALYNPVFENTRRKVNERRMLTLREIGERTSLAKNVKEFWQQVHSGLEYNEWDIPFALIYSVSQHPESDISSLHSSSLSNPPSISLEGSLGVPAGHGCAVPFIDLGSDEGFAPYMRTSMSQPATPTVLSDASGAFPHRLVEGVQWRGFGDPSRTIVVFPIYLTTGESVVGFIVMGINPRRPYNDDYALFINLLSRQLATSMASVVLFEDEIQRGQQAARLAALDRQQLSVELSLRTQEAVESEDKFTRMAEFAPVGIFITNAEGQINFCNESWWEISRHSRTINSVDAWKESIAEDDQAAVEAAWKTLIEEKVPVTQEFRFKATLESDGRPIDRWALMSAYPEKDSEGVTKAIFGCLTDISNQKWAEAFQKQRREEAMELKRQQENFIDMTSHEMRNPLSAVCQCADEIIGSIVSYRKKNNVQITEALNKMLETCLEAANTISLCANHQKRIVDDVLTLSRLDSRMVTVTPVICKPLEVIERALKMLEIELVTKNIKAEFRVDRSYHEMDIQSAKLDPARLQQILVNLLTNAIKFIQKQEERSIIIKLGASKDVSKAQVAGIEYFHDESAAKKDITDEEGWGDGEKFNLHISVADTGPGLTDEERSMLFQRFMQASPRTHVEYGGSGLGLFISRMLTEIQGGQIGVLSTKGVGSTFAFYIQSRKCSRAQPVSPSVPREGFDVLSVEPAISPSNIEILVVEDNAVNQKVLARLLRNRGFQVHLANHGGEAIEKLQQSRHWDHEAATAAGYELMSLDKNENTLNISIILLDLEMPIMDGTTCARTIRKLEGQGVLTTRLPIIAVTAYVREEKIREAKASGMDGIVSKPFRAHELTPKIKELVANPPSGLPMHSSLSMTSTEHANGEM